MLTDWTTNAPDRAPDGVAAPRRRAAPREQRGAWPPTAVEPPPRRERDAVGGLHHRVHAALERARARRSASTTRRRGSRSRRRASTATDEHERRQRARQRERADGRFGSLAIMIRERAPAWRLLLLLADPARGRRSGRSPAGAPWATRRSSARRAGRTGIAARPSPSRPTSPPMRLVPRKTPPVSMRMLLRVDVALDLALREDLEVARADHVADRPGPGDDDVGAAHAAAHDAALADDDRRPRVDRALDGAVDAERAVGGQVTADRARAPEDVFDGVSRRSAPSGFDRHAIADPPASKHRAIPGELKAIRRRVGSVTQSTRRASASKTTLEAPIG